MHIALISMCIGDMRDIMSAHSLLISAQSIIIRIICASIMAPGMSIQYAIVCSHIVEHVMQSSIAFCMLLSIFSV
ncbi:hypothetical protein GCM10010399_07630 [Dactylosporangium fulvum]